MPASGWCFREFVSNNNTKKKWQIKQDILFQNMEVEDYSCTSVMYH